MICNLFINLFCQWFPASIWSSYPLLDRPVEVILSLLKSVSNTIYVVLGATQGQPE